MKNGARMPREARSPVGPARTPTPSAGSRPGPTSGQPADILRLMALLGETFAGPTWSAWRTVLRALLALPMSDEDVSLFRTLTAWPHLGAGLIRELWAVVGRRGGKSIVASLIAVYLTTCRSYRLAPGERGVFMVIAADRRQARILREYIGGLLVATPALSQLVARETQETVELTNGITIEIMTASHVAVRGYTCVGAVCDELAFWPTDTSASPDIEVLRALRPSMATVPGSMLICLSSPYAQRGALYQAFKRHYGNPGDVLVVRAPSRTMNPSIPQSEIDRALEDDEVAARSEWLAEFRSDIESYVSREAVERCVVDKRRELPPSKDISYRAFVDPSGGSRDSFTLCIGHQETRGGHTVAVVDALRERRAPFSPTPVVEEFSKVLKAYRVTKIEGDRYAGEWPAEAFRRYGITYEPAGKVKSDLYRDALAILNAQRIELPDDDRLVTQLVSLERRTSRGGRDSIDHPPSGSDDLANVVAGLACKLTLAKDDETNWEAINAWLDTSSSSGTNAGPTYRINGKRVSERAYWRARREHGIAREGQPW